MLILTKANMFEGNVHYTSGKQAGRNSTNVRLHLLGVYLFRDLNTSTSVLVTIQRDMCAH